MRLRSLKGETILKTSGASRRVVKLFPRHCERSEAIHAAGKKEWIALLRSQ
jgi:hypothetical protein